jgi:hypothetical protein
MLVSKGWNNILELPEVGSGFLCCSPVFVIVRVRLLERIEFSLVFAFGCCQSSALLSILLSTMADKKPMIKYMFG